MKHDLNPFLSSFLFQELGHDPNLWQLQMDHNRQVHILPRSQSQETDPTKVSSRSTLTLSRAGALLFSLKMPKNWNIYYQYFLGTETLPLCPVSRPTYDGRRRYTISKMKNGRQMLFSYLLNGGLKTKKSI